MRKRPYSPEEIERRRVYVRDRARRIRANMTPEQTERARTYQREYTRMKRSKAACTPKDWALRRQYLRDYKTTHLEKFTQQQRDSQRRILADPDRRAEFNVRQKRYYHEKRPFKHAWRAKHGFFLETSAQLRELQNNACAVCRRPFDESKKGTKAHNDHDHASGKPRGLLCFHCNVIEGKLLAINMTPIEFGQRLHDYLINPPANLLKTNC